jgi:hypothetical protein
MKLLILFGPPAVGKLTVGKLVAAQTGFTLFHNHMVMEGVMDLFGVGTPAEDRLSKLIRTEVIREAAEAGMNLLFTYVWNFGMEKGKQNIDSYKALYEARGGQVYFVELTAPLATRVARAGTSDRRSEKKNAPLPDEVTHLDEARDFTSPNPFYCPAQYTKVDTEGKTPEQIAATIAALPFFGSE